MAGHRPIELDVTNIAHGGISVARLDGRVVFVTDAIPGERVLARDQRATRKKSFWRAETVAVLEPSEHRQPHVWAAASIDRDPDDRAGGAEFGHIDLAHQRELKRQVLVDSLQRMAERRARRHGRGRSPATTSATAPAGAPACACTSTTTGRSARTPRARTASSRSTDLPLATAERRRGGAARRRASPGDEHVDVLAPSTGGARLIVGTQKPSDDHRGRRRPRVPPRRHAGSGRCTARAAATLTARRAGRDRRRAASTRAPPTSTSTAASACSPPPSATASAPATRITSVESDAARHRATPPRTSPSGSARAPRPPGSSAGSATLAQTAGAPSATRLAAATVVLDPPALGRRARASSTALAALAPAQVVYVACDPVAFARDVGAVRRARLRARAPARLRPLPEHPPRRGGRHARPRVTDRRGCTPAPVRWWQPIRTTRTGRMVDRQTRPRRSRCRSDARARRRRRRPRVGATRPQGGVHRRGLRVRARRGHRAGARRRPRRPRGRRRRARPVARRRLDASPTTSSACRPPAPPCSCTASPTASRACARRSPPAPPASSRSRRRPRPCIAAAATVARGEVLNNLEWATAIDADRDFAKAQLGRREREILHLYASGLPLKLAAAAARHRLLDRARVPRPHPREVRRGRSPGADEGRPAASRGRRRDPARSRSGRRRWPLSDQLVAAVSAGASSPREPDQPPAGRDGHLALGRRLRHRLRRADGARGCSASSTRPSRPWLVDRRAAPCSARLVVVLHRCRSLQRVGALGARRCSRSSTCSPC